ncbi:MAG: hypothetical protein ABIH82_00955 [Candidatus Woesearchaeota archaeon]
MVEVYTEYKDKVIEEGLKSIDTDIAGGFQWFNEIFSEWGFGFGALGVTDLTYAFPPLGLVVDLFGTIVSWAVGSDDKLALPPLVYTKSYARTKPGILCGNDHKWQECNEYQKNKLYWITMTFNLGGDYHEIPVFPYHCVQTNLGFKWELVELDKDGDGYQESQDCNDLPIINENCPLPDIGNYQYQTLNQIRDSAKALCNNIKYSACAICINPSAPEICGDEIDNDCNPDTPDNCNFFEAGCEQLSEEILDDGGNPVSDEADNTIFKNHNNIFNKKYSWIDTDEGGYCCGYNGDTDLGLIKADGDFERICLPDQNEITDEFGNSVVGYDQDLMHPPGWDEGEGSDTCEGRNWCFVKITE